jgi:hypothetical protein
MVTVNEFAVDGLLWRLAGVEHVTVELEVHAVVKQRPPWMSRRDGVTTPKPKLRPEMVTAVAPVSGEFAPRTLFSCVSTGVS